MSNPLIEWKPYLCCNCAAPRLFPGPDFPDKRGWERCLNCGTYQEFRQAKDRPEYPFLSARFLEAMDEIGRYGHEKYGAFSFHHRRVLGDCSRGDHPRTRPDAIAEHAAEHFRMHIRGELHDHFQTRRHQLAAVAFNAMMEFYFAGLDDEIEAAKIP